MSSHCALPTEAIASEFTQHLESLRFSTQRLSTAATTEIVEHARTAETATKALCTKLAVTQAWGDKAAVNACDLQLLLEYCAKNSLRLTNELFNVDSSGRIVGFRTRSIGVFKVESFEGLEYLSALTYLELSNNGQPNLKPLEHLHHLNFLMLNYNGIDDLKPLAELSALRILGAPSNQITDLSPLSNLPNLEVLLVHANPLSDLTPLSKASNLKILNIRGTEVSDLTPLVGCPSLETLSLGGTPAWRAEKQAVETLRAQGVEVKE